MASSLSRFRRPRLIVLTHRAASLVCVTSPAAAKTMIDYFQLIPIVGK
jgi:hypothetical protein